MEQVTNEKKMLRILVKQNMNEHEDCPTLKVVFHTKNLFSYLINYFSVTFKSNMTEFVLPIQDKSLLPFLLL